MTVVRELLSRKGSKVKVDEGVSALPNGVDAAAIRDSFDQDFQNIPTWAQESTIRLTAAAICRAAGRDADAETAFKQAAELTADGVVAGARTWVYGVSDAHRPFVEWGDFLYDRERYHESAARFLEGWKRFPEQPLLLFLSGKSLAKAGDAKEGERRMELSHWVALGQERVRGKFLDELVRRGEATAAKREIDLVVRGCWCRDHYYGNVMNQASQAAVLNRDFATAEKCRQRSLLIILKTPDVFFVEQSAYMNVPRFAGVCTRTRLSEGSLRKRWSSREVLSVTPGHLDLVCGMVPELDKLGKKAEAGELLVGVVRLPEATRRIPEERLGAQLARDTLRELPARTR